jgi:hypothetical protein
MAVLGISTNTRLLGTAIITEGQLTAYQVRLFKASWSASKATRIITSLEPCVRQYSIKRVILSTPLVYHQTEAYKLLHTRLYQYFTRKGITVIGTSPDKLLLLCRDGDRKGKKSLMQALCTRYPELRYFHIKELRNKKKYYIKLFEAVAAATLHGE